MKEIASYLFGICEAFTAFINFVITFIQDLVSMVVTLVKLPAILGTVLEWTNVIGILPYITCIIGLAIVYKILGR